jgi:histone deacetylase 11
MSAVTGNRLLGMACWLLFGLVLFLLIVFAAFASRSFPNSDPSSLNLSLSYKDNIPIVYGDSYNITFWGFEEAHPFDSKKYGRIFSLLKEKVGAGTDKFIKPVKPSRELLELAHSKAYLDSLQSSATLARITELDFLRFFPDQTSRNVLLEPMLYQAGGSVAAAFAALEHGWAINLGGGFHHASSDQGGGFCAIADIGMIVKVLRREKKLKKVMIIDLDAHQGNGHERDFLNDPDTYIVDFYNHQIYPNDIEAKPGIDLKVGLDAFTEDSYYFEQMDAKLPEAFQAFKPELVIYIAGTDVLAGDPLGLLSISEDGIIARDEKVFRMAMEHKIPIVMLLGGGYQKSNAAVIAKSILNLREKFKLF